MSLPEKELIESLKIQWKKLWRERVDDKERAEGMAMSDFSSLFVERGTVIHATKDFKTLDFKEILEQHKIGNAYRHIPLSPHIGGWTKFVKMNLKRQRPQRRRLEFYEEKPRKQQLKKSGRGWLHL